MYMSLKSSSTSQDSSLENNDEYAEAIRIFGVESIFNVYNIKEYKLCPRTWPRDRYFAAERSPFQNDVILAIASSESSQTSTGNNEQRRPLNILNYKRKPCTNFHTFGRCPYQDKCNFYHDMGEKNFARFKNRPCRNWMSTGSCHFGSKCLFAHGFDEISPKFKTSLCKAFMETGTCPYGAHCNYAHGENEKRVTISTVAGYKAQICERWLIGNCLIGPACNFAHGANELQPQRTLSRF
ncbi:unnamed protein product [Clavelina lepadiformis]|uniref:C3H1-type domain-containing protein n=1 Tax=Clavelina lepadiformis TaxID=159417 RepID=A0ABP0FNV2_CLALP